jgi:hypothetical protein
MIPITDLVPENLYSQEDAPFLLGTGFSEDAAREAICAACRAGQLVNVRWRRRYWFSGRAFLDWVASWFGDEAIRELACRSGTSQNAPRRTGPAPGEGSL